MTAMDKQTPSDREEQDEQDIARLLRESGPREALPADLKQRWEAQFRTDLKPVLVRRRQWRRTLVLGLCASAATLLVAVGVWRTTAEQAVPEILVSHVSGEHLLYAPNGVAETLHVNRQLTTGSEIQTSDNGHVAIAYGGYDLRLNSATRVALHNDHINLLEGQIYASDRPQAATHNSLRIDTIHGSIRDVGTQFMVALLTQQTVATVRRGALLVSAGSAGIRAAAAPGTATRVVIAPQGRLSDTQVEPTGAAWRWIYEGAPAFTLDGRSAYEFLQWSVTESGLRLAFASRAAERRARTTFLHGDISTLDPEQAVAPVLASTDLVAHRTADNILLVSLLAGR
ncbi:MAG: FecR domain-containing protein [Halioglobus sp.]|nr:FecR domain-containing protein [Halioglobus sp.]